MATATRYLTGPALALVLAFALPPPSAAQDAPAPDGAGASAPGVTVRFDGVVDVGSLPPAPRSLQGTGRKPFPFRPTDPEGLAAGKQAGPAGGGAAAAAGSAATSEAPLDASVLASFIGLRLSDTVGVQGFGAIPPDTQVAAGPNHLFEAVNVSARIFTKTGVPISTFTFASFFGYTPGIDTDPKVRFDPQSNRWFVVIVTDQDTQGSWRLGVSATSDPTGLFFKYTFSTPGSFPDFPSLGISDDKVILTANAFQCTTVCTNIFQGTEFLVINKSQLLLGSASPASNFFAPPQGAATIQAAHSLSPTTTHFMAARMGDPAFQIRIWSVTGVPGLGPGAIVSFLDRPIAQLASPPDAVQAGTARLIATNDNRLLDAVFRSGSMWLAANAACVPAGDATMRACMRFIQILTGGLAVNQDFNFGSAGTHYYYPAVQTDSSNNLLTVFTRSSATEFASAYASGRFATDPPNTLNTPTLVKPGEAPYNPIFDRWGDYSGAGIDPLDQTTVWVAGEYARIEDGSEWGTWIARLRLTPPVFTGGVYVAAGQFNGDGFPDFVTGPGPGGGPEVRIFSGFNPTVLLSSFLAYGAGFTGGVRVAVGDVNGDGVPDVITAPGPGGGPHVRAFSGLNLAIELASFFAYAPGFTGGVCLGACDVNGDGQADIITGADAGGGPHVRVFSGAALPGLVELASFFAYAPGFTGGVRVAAGDVNDDGFADVLTAAGPGGGPHVRAFSGAALPGLVELAGFFAYAAGFAGGVFVAAGDVNGDGVADIITGPDAGGGPHVRVFSGAALPGLAELASFFAYPAAFGGGVRVGAADVNSDGFADIFTAQGPGAGPEVRAFSGANPAVMLKSFLAY